MFLGLSKVRKKNNLEGYLVENEVESEVAGTESAISRDMKKTNLIAAFALSICVLALSSVAVAQVDESFGETVDVHLVTLEVAVESRFGREPIMDLTQEDFTVWEDGEIRPITHFERIQEGRVQWVQGPKGEEWSVPDAAEAEVTQYVGLTFDFDSLRRPFLKRAVHAALRFIKNDANPSTQFSIIVLGDEPYVVQPFTTDRQRISEILGSLDSLLKGEKSLVFSPSFGVKDDLATKLRVTSDEVEDYSSYLFEDVAQSQELLDRFERNLCFWEAVAYGDNLSEVFNGWPKNEGSKSLVLFYEPETGCVSPFSGDGVLVKHRFGTYLDEVARIAVGAGIKVYAAEATGLQRTAPTGRQPRLGSSDESPMSTARQAILEQISKRTGGRQVKLNNLAEGLLLAQETSSNHYRVSFQVERSHDGETHSLEIRVKHPKATLVRHATSYLDQDARTRLLAQLETSGRLPKTGGTLPVSVSVESGWTEGEAVQATISLPLETLTNGWVSGKEMKKVEFFVAVYGLDGKLLFIDSDVQKLAFVEKGDHSVQQSFAMDLPQGDFIVALAALDSVNGKVGVDFQQIHP